MISDPIGVRAGRRRTLRGPRFLLGALSAALLVASLTGAGLAVSGTPGAGSQGQYRLPRPVLTLAGPQRGAFGESRSAAAGLPARAGKDGRTARI
jgi:hypothetical protein